jgi:tetratricopeptide (TPR) repeat protein
VAAGLSQRQLSFPGCSPAYISRIESGDRIPSLQLLRELGGRLDVTEDYLATGMVAGQDAELLDAEIALRLDDTETAESLYLDALNRAGRSEERARALEGLGQLAFRQGRPREAIKHFEEALRLYGDSEFKHPSLADSLGRSYATIGEPESSIGIFERCLDQARDMQNVLEEMRFLVLLGYALVDAGNFGRAEELLGQALARGKDMEDPQVRVSLYWSQSRLHAERNDSETASRYARRALEYLLLTEDSRRTALAYQLLAHIELDRGNPEEARELLEQGWPLLEQSGNALERAQYRLEEARALAKLGRNEEAAALAMQISGLIGDGAPEDAARSYTLLGSVYEELGESARAREVYELAEELLKPRNPNRYLIDVYSKLADLAEREGRREEAYEYMKKAVGMQKAVAASSPVH